MDLKHEEPRLRHREDQDIHQHLPQKNPLDPMAWDHQQQRTLETDQATTSRRKGAGDGLDTHSCITRPALNWNPQEKRKRGHPRNVWRHDLEAETKRMGYTWWQLERLAQGRDAWKALVGGLCCSRGQRQWWWWWWIIKEREMDNLLLCRLRKIPGSYRNYVTYPFFLSCPGSSKTTKMTSNLHLIC